MVKVSKLPGVGVFESRRAIAVVTGCGLAFVPLIHESGAQRNLIAAVYFGYILAYGLLATGLLQPSSVVARELPEWRARVLSQVNASLCFFGSLLCFSEWSGYTAEDAYICRTKECGWDNTWTAPVASCFVGFLMWDLTWVIWHDPQWHYLVHHILFSAMTHYLLYYHLLRVPFAWLAVGELSTIFLNWRWFLAVSGRKETTSYSLASFGFALAFLITRTVGYSLGASRLFLDSPSDPVLLPAHLAIAAGWCLNMVWTVPVLKNLWRAVTGKKREKSA